MAAGVLVWMLTIDGTIGDKGRSLRQVDFYSAVRWAAGAGILVVLLADLRITAFEPTAADQGTDAYAAPRSLGRRATRAAYS